nr:hypothetical protein [uncultured Desulfobulbus sp.]
MNMRYLLGVFMGILVSGSPGWSADFPWEVQLPFKEATIHYQLKGTEQGEETLYIKDYGRLRAKYHKGATTVMGMSTRTETVEMQDPDWIFTYDLVAKTGSKSTNPSKLFKQEYTKLSSSEKKNFEKNAKVLGAGMMAQMGGSVTRTSATFMDYVCDVVTIQGMSTSTVFQGTDIPLKSEISMMGMMNSTIATKVDTSTAIPESVFSPPSGITAELDLQAEAMMQGTIQQMVSSLKEPDGAVKMQQQAQGATMMMPERQKAMELDGMSGEEQQEMMRQMREAMEQMQKMRQQ